MKIKKYGAIDIGSNAVRLLVSNVIKDKGKEPQFKKSSLVRVPIRLGADVFVDGKISEENIDRMIDAMKAFKLLMKVHKIKKYKACATSAMREATNGQEVANKILENTGVEINIIDGKEEASIISSADLDKLINTKGNFLYVDVGGGSTEFTLFSEGKTVATKSFKMGTVRLLNNKKAVNKKGFEEIEQWVKAHTSELKSISLIGSGGNINKLFKMSGLELGRPMSYIYMSAQYQFLKKMTYEQRISELGLNPDRADVIIPATKIYLTAMKSCGAKKIYVPKIGLSDGIIKALYYKKI